MAPKVGDVVEVLIRSRTGRTGQAWVPGVITAMSEPAPPKFAVNKPPYLVVNGNRTPPAVLLRIRTFCQDPVADALLYQAHQVKKVNVLLAIALASADKGELVGLGPYEAPHDYDDVPCAEPPEAKDADPEEIAKRVAALDFTRNAGRPKPLLPHDEIS